MKNQLVIKLQPFPAEIESKIFFTNPSLVGCNQRDAETIFSSNHEILLDAVDDDETFNTDGSPSPDDVSTSER